MPATAAARRRWSALGARFLPGGHGGRRATPTILQMEAVECGAACLAMVLAHHRRFVPLEELRVACGVSRDGSKASNLLRAARTYGLEARGYKKEPGDLAAMEFPMIVHWNFNHFIVVEGFGGDRVFLNDPAQGPRTVSQEEFDQAFTGVAMIFRRGPDFRPAGRPAGILSSLRDRLSGGRSGLLYVVLAGLMLVLPGIVAPTFTRVFVDEVLVRGLHSWIRPLLILMALTAVLQGVLVWLQQHHLLRLEGRLSLGGSGRFFWHVLRLPVGFFAQRFAGEIAGRVAINDRVARLLSRDLATTALSVVVIAFYAMLMAQYDLVLTAVSVGVVTLNFLVLRYTHRVREDLNRRLVQDRGKLTGVAMGGLQTIETLKATGSENDFFARWSGHQAKVVNASQQFGIVTQVLAVVPTLLLAVNTSLILGIGGLRVVEGQLTMGMLIAFQALTLAFILPVNQLVGLGATLQEVKADLNRLDDVLRADVDPYAREVGETDGGRSSDAEPVKLTGHLELRGVTFGYSPLDKPLIEDFDLVLTPGARVALVGGSGSGKSTVARLVSGLYEPWSGEILFDGRPRADIPRDVMSNSVAIVDQDIFLFEGSVRDNLTLWDATVEERELVRAARDAHIHDELMARPGAYGSPVEESGRNFSGGQRQRLEIARALAGEPTLLVLDEATSALDPTTEKAIDDHLRRRGCTCLIVAHRLSTIRDCDEIIVLQRGRVAQRGTHASLMAEPGPYSRLVSAE